MEQYYFWYKAFHIIGMVVWMAALFYLPRLFVYHVENKDNEGFVKVVKIQERKLYYFISFPGMIITFISAILLVYSLPGIMKSGGWIHLKATLAIVLVIFHFSCGFFRKRLLKNKFVSAKFFRFYNEIPTVILITIVFLVIFRPF